jgi:hypothetical protein
MNMIATKSAPWRNKLAGAKKLVLSPDLTSLANTSVNAMPTTLPQANKRPEDAYGGGWEREVER